MSDRWSDESDCAKQICLSSHCKFVIERSLLCMVLPIWIAFHNCTLRWQCEMHRSRGQPPPMPFVAICWPAIEVVSAAWQVRVYVWPSPSVNDLYVLDLAEAAISVMAIISQPHCSCSPVALFPPPCASPPSFTLSCLKLLYNWYY